MALRSVVCFLKVLSTKIKKIFVSQLYFTQKLHTKFHTLISQDYFFEIIFLITNKANKAPIISATI